MRALIGVVLITVLPSVGHSQRVTQLLGSDSSSPLFALNRVFVGVLQDNDSISSRGVTERAIRGVVETGLRDAGIEVINRAAARELDAYYFVEIFALPFPAPDGTVIGYVISVVSNLYETAALARTPGRQVAVTSWSATATGFAGRNELGAILTHVERHVDKFLNAHRVANRRDQ